MAQRPSTRLRLLEPPPAIRKVPDRVCSNCVHATIGPFGVHCTLFGDDIHRETIALECEAWEPSYC